MPKQGPASRPVLSLERKLPILIGGLVTLALAATLLQVRVELRDSALRTASARLNDVATEFTRLIGESLAARMRLVAQVTGSAAVRDRLLGDAVDDDVLHQQLDRLRAPSDQDLPIQLRARDGTVIASTGLAGTAIEAGGGPPRADTLYYGVINPDAAGGTYWVAAPVVHEGRVIGHITQLRRTARIPNSDRLERLLGDGIAMYFAHVDGGAWAGLDGGVLARPPRLQLAAPFGWTNPDDDRRHRAVARRIEGSPWVLVVDLPMDVVVAGSDRVLRRIGMVGVILLALGLLGAWVVSRSVTRPLSALGEAADAIARGEYSRRTGMQRSDEIGRLAHSFDTMAARVDATHAETQRRFDQAQRLAAELETANARLHDAIRDAENARLEAQEANTAKSEFLATMSHEIRTPINAIVGYTDLLDMRLPGPLTPEQEEYIRRIRLGGEHLVSVVNDVLDFARIESGQMRISRDVCSVRPIIDAAVSILQARARARAISISIECPLQAVFLGDAQRVQQVLLNLLSNAIKFTDEGGSVRIACERRESTGIGGHDGAASSAWTCVEVVDDGIGIASDQLNLIFEPFVQGTSGYTRTHGGTGLGLAISRSLAHMMGGDLTVESAAGAGATFTLWLPHPASASVAA